MSIYLDIVVVEAENIVVQNVQTSEFIRLKKPFCRVCSLTQHNETSSYKQNSNTPIWNQDCTFTCSDEFEEIEVELYEKKSYSHKAATRRLLGHIVLGLTELPWNSCQDIWKEINPSDSTKYLVTGKIHIKAYKGRDPHKMLLSHFGNPLKEVPIRLNPGDLILCASNTLITHTVHISTRSRWDHVAMVVKVRGHDTLRLFEATMDGVEAYYLNTGLKYYLQNGRVAIRRIMLQRNEIFSETLYDFVDEVIGRPYKHDWIQIVRSAYNANEEDDLSSLFCSQLIAAAYQRLGLISKDVLSNNFVPSDFATDLQGQFNGARISPLRKIPAPKQQNEIRLRDGVANSPNINVKFDIKDHDPICNIKFTDTAVKRDEKLNTYTVYITNITTENGWTWILFKRFTDFVLLDKELKKYFTHIPSLPKKVFGKSDPESVQKRRIGLQHYTRALVRSPVIHCSLFIEFFTQGRKGLVQDPSRIKTKKKSKRKVKKSSRKSETPEKDSPRRSKLSKSKSETITERKSERRSSKKLSTSPKQSRPRAAVSLHNQMLIKNSCRSGSNPEPVSWVKVSASPKIEKRASYLRASSESLPGAIPIADVNSMFDTENQPSQESLDSVPSVATRPTQRLRSQRHSAKFYKNKFKQGIDSLSFAELSDDDDSDGDGDENVNLDQHEPSKPPKSNLNFEDLGLTDQDLAEFGIGTNSKKAFLDRGVSILDIKQLLNEVSDVVSFSDSDEETVQG